jgi:malonyl-CoA/methylmalonyl-CoA synthetase
MTAMQRAWQWTHNDRILQFLPLHHVHGIVNVYKRERDERLFYCVLLSLFILFIVAYIQILNTCLLSGATCEMMAFNPLLVWKRLMADDTLTLFMAVPTIYGKSTFYS